MKRVPVVASLLRLSVISGVVLLILLLTGCTERRDVTYDPKYGDFKAALGTWKSKIPLSVCTTIADPGVFLASTDWAQGQGRHELLAVPIGSEVQIERLILWKTFETSGMNVCGKLVAGSHAGKELILDQNVFFPREGTSKSRWAVVPENFERVAPPFSPAK